MNKTAIKNLAIWARNKLIANISYKAGLLGITEKEIKSPLPQSTQTVQFFDIGTKEPSSITGHEIEQRKKLVEEIQRKFNQSDYPTAYKNVIEEVAYTWFNRLIAIRFMEVNDYLPTRIRVLSSESNGKAEPDLVTHAMEVSLDYSAYEKDRIMQLKHENKLDELFRMLFIKQCNALNANLPELFEKTSDYTELLLNVSFTDKDGVVYHLVNDISENDFNVSEEGQVEIIGWLYQYYNTEPKDETFALLKKNVKITKDRIPAATQLFTPDWIVRYMVENSLGRLWIEGHPNNELKSNWKYYLDEAEQQEDVQKQLGKIREEYKTIKPEDIKVIDPAMGSGHILVYAFDVLMQIYESYGYSQRDAAKSIVEKNIYGLDIDNRAYQLAYFAVMMKARQYNRRILNGETTCHVNAIQESNDINRNQLKYFGVGLSDMEKNTALLQIQGMLDTFTDAKEYGSILNIEDYNWELLRKFINVIDADGQMSLDSIGIENTKDQLDLLVEIGQVMARKYDVVVTNPPYMGTSNMGTKLFEYVKVNFASFKSDLFAVFIQKCNSMTKLRGYYALITQQAWMFKSSYRELRKELYQYDIVNMIHLGARAFDDISGEVVQTTSFVQRKEYVNGYIGSYTSLVNENSQQEKEIRFLKRDSLFYSTIENFIPLPSSPLAYWVTNNISSCYLRFPPFEKYLNARAGLNTSDNDRFVRCWYEVSRRKIGFECVSHEDFIKSGKKFALFNKGGGFRKWYGNQYYVLAYDSVNFETLCQIGNHLPSRQYYFRPSITWNRIAPVESFSARICNNGFAFDDVSPSAFSNYETLLYAMGFCNTVVFRTLISVLNRGMKTETGNVQKVPFSLREDFKNTIQELVIDNVEISKNDWDSFEISWDFKKHPLIHLNDKNNTTGNSNQMVLCNLFKKWESDRVNYFERLKSNEEKLNRIFIDIYNLKEDLTPHIYNKDITIRKADISRDIRSLISYAVGCMFGRYSLDTEGVVYTGNVWDENNYSTFMPDKDNVLPITDEEYFKDDIVELFIGFVKKVYGGETLEENLDFIAKALGNNGKSSREIIRGYFIKDFFNDHCKVYQKRPIYWLYDSGKQNGFRALIYMHRYNENTIGNLRIDYLHRMQRIYENEIARMQDTIENSKDAREVTTVTKRKEKLIKQLQETKEYDEKIAHLALARISIDLDDGLKVNYEKVQTDTDGKKLNVLATI